MPKLTIDNYWKIDATLEGMGQRSEDASRSWRELEATIDTALERPMDLALANGLLASLNAYRQNEWSYCNFLKSFSEDSEMGLAGKMIDVVKDRQSVMQTAPAPR
ncbi:MAG: hypothetical protein WDN45_08240 [Caulobacteraceae bacterium]